MNKVTTLLLGFTISFVTIAQTFNVGGPVSFNSNVLSNNFKTNEHVMPTFDLEKQLDEDLFTGNTNIQDILNTQLSVSNRMVSRLRIGTLSQNGYELVGDPTCEPFFDRFENILAGWATTFTVQILNDIDVC